MARGGLGRDYRPDQGRSPAIIELGCPSLVVGPVGLDGRDLARLRGLGCLCHSLFERQSPVRDLLD